MYEIDKDLKGNPVIFEGVKLDKETLVVHLNTLIEALAFYSDPETYHAVSVIVDRPCGEFADDFSDNDDYDYPKPGKLARDTFKELYSEIMNKGNK